MKNLKVSSLFHWLYGAVMFLPILLLPVFMIYSHRHTIDSGSIDVPQNEVVDFNQIYDEPYNEDVTYYPNIQEGQYYYANINSNLVSLELNHIYQFRLYIFDSSSNFRLFRLFFNQYHTDFDIPNSSNVNDFQFTNNEGGTLFRIYGFDNNYINVSYSLNFFDLTQMFGAGNEPTLQQFNVWYSDDYYAYTLSRNELLKNVSITTYSDTDIMSQATYQLYNATDKYFNISQFFGFENLWDFMLLNWFGGNVTIYLRIFWQLLTYWLVVSIAWLIFDLFMYVPKLAHRWLDRSAIE